MLFSYSGDCSGCCRRSFSRRKLRLELVVVCECGPRRARAEVCLNNLSKSQVDISKARISSRKFTQWANWSALESERRISDKFQRVSFPTSCFMDSIALQTWVKHNKRISTESSGRQDLEKGGNGLCKLELRVLSPALCWQRHWSQVLS